MSFTKLNNHSELLCGCDFANERLTRENSHATSLRAKQLNK